MKQEETKYTFVYNEIKQRILSGHMESVFPLQECFVSSSM